MKAFFVMPILLLLCLNGTTFSQDKRESDGETFGPEARSAYLRWKKATEAADRAYLTELSSCLASATQKGQLDEATAIKKEINRLTALLIGVTIQPLAEYLVGTTWENPVNGVTVTLNADGKGVRQGKGNESWITYEIVSEKQFTIRWPTAPTSQCALDAERRTFVSGDVTWERKP